MTSVYSVFYELDGMFDIYRTDFSSFDEVICWVNKLSKSANSKLHFVLKDGHELVQGKLIDDSMEFMDDCMQFAKLIDAESVLIVHPAGNFCYN